MKTTYSRTESVWQRMNNSEKKAVMAYGEKYKAFLDKARTERQSVNFIIEAAEKKGFKPLYDLKALHEGDKVYWNQKGKSVILAVIGKEPVKEGLKIVGSHIDAPRLDLKGNPVHEQGWPCLLPYPLLRRHQEVSVALHSPGPVRRHLYAKRQEDRGQYRHGRK